MLRTSLHIEPSYFHIHSLLLFFFFSLRSDDSTFSFILFSSFFFFSGLFRFGLTCKLRFLHHLQAPMPRVGTHAGFASPASSGHMGRCSSYSTKFRFHSTKLLVAGHSALSVQLTVSELFTQFPYGHTALVYTHQASSSASLAGVPASAFLAVSVCFAVSHTAHQSRSLLAA